ncbi:hypothetical protein CARUB_v10010805mg [Capsella rubella]|uniref:Uncharacterized protein n=1 Tax=Capsella rubella TaxID=81985 RepID=R0I8M3_9BRAS|nr:hypothetical protein CARUB_v10010805mg [Capsella rubella]
MLASKILTSMLILSSGSSMRCLITFASSRFLIVKSALVAISIPGIRSKFVFYNSQGFISFLALLVMADPSLALVD